MMPVAFFTLSDEWEDGRQETEVPSMLEFTKSYIALVPFTGRKADIQIKEFENTLFCQLAYFVWSAERKTENNCLAGRQGRSKDR